MRSRVLVAIPVRNEEATLEEVLRGCAAAGCAVLVVDDASTDRSPEIARRFARVIRHPEPSGYGAALITAFRHALREGVDVLITLDADGQHPPEWIPRFLEALERTGADVVSGSRYHPEAPRVDPPPAERRRINRWITFYLRRFWGLPITDAFCGYKAYTSRALALLRDLDEPGYGMPLEAWLRLACGGARIAEIPVPLLYPDPHRQFPGEIREMWRRWRYYAAVIRKTREKLLVEGKTLVTPEEKRCA